MGHPQNRVILQLDGRGTLDYCRAPGLNPSLTVALSQNWHKTHRPVPQARVQNFKEDPHGPKRTTGNSANGKNLKAKFRCRWAADSS